MAKTKKEIDKELMYKKIMPTASSVSSDSTIKIITGNTAALQEEPTVQQTENTPALTKAESQDIALTTKLSLESTKVINLMEGLVEARMDAAMQKFSCCTCDKCRNDVAAITLNKLAPCYVIEENPILRDEMDRKRAAEVATALVQAILVVKARPSHEV
ncbi:MAG: late competence development ComFB family protein [Oscillospiraceae bacterium]|nr:late competence development ComFB family protein [Oscillospiraceae bacterium]